MKKFLIAALMLSSAAAYAQDSEWVTIASSSTCAFQARKGSLEIATTRGGETIAVIIVQTACSDTTKITVGKRYVRASDCRRGYGKLVATDLEGAFLFENDFASGGSSVGAGIAEVICAAARQEVKTQNDKSI